MAPIVGSLGIGKRNSHPWQFAGEGEAGGGSKSSPIPDRIRRGERPWLQIDVVDLQADGPS